MIAEWVHAHLPAFLSRLGPGGVEHWQMLLLPVLFFAAFLTASVLSAGLTRLILRLARFTKTRRDDLLVLMLRGPARLLLTGVFALVFLPPLELHGKVNELCFDITRITLLMAGFWSLLRAVDIGHEVLRLSQWMAGRPAAAPVLALGRRIAKIVIYTLAVVTSLQQFGYPVTGIIAGLGVGGLAVALAAQKTLENLLGSVMLTVDQPLREGDLVKVEDVQGIVEHIGLRSTRIRTLARTVVTIPNGKLADSRIEDFADRDRVFLGVSIALAHGCSVDQVTAFLTALRQKLSAHPQRAQTEQFVHLRDLVADALVVEVQAWFQLTPGTEFRDVREDFLLFTMREAARLGLSLTVRQGSAA